MKCVKRADLPPEDEADLKMEVKLLQEVRIDYCRGLNFFFCKLQFRAVPMVSVVSVVPSVV